MSLDFQQVQQQVRLMGENASAREQQLKNLRQQACDLLSANAQDFQAVRDKVKQIVASYDHFLRCAMPLDQAIRKPEPLDASFPLPGLPKQASVLAADGSQIPLDRNAEVAYCLVNVGAICLHLGQPEPPHPMIKSRLFYDQELFTASGTITDADLAVMRDELERSELARLAETSTPPVVTFTDGPMELWGAKDAGGESSEFSKHLEKYLHALSKLQSLDAITAGYVDKPMENLVVRLLEVVMLSGPELQEVRKLHPLRGVTDHELYHDLLQPGERSAVFALQSPSVRRYREGLALHFFYLNVGRENRPWLARVELPAWVAADAEKLDILHAVLVDQCRVLGSRHFPYLLHRAHETAVVSLEERDQVTQMIAQELRRRGVTVGERSQKQGLKELEGRKRYS